MFAVPSSSSQAQARQSRAVLAVVSLKAANMRASRREQ